MTCKECGLKKRISRSELNILQQTSSDLDGTRDQVIDILEDYFADADTTLNESGLKRKINGGLVEAKKGIDLLIGAIKQSGKL